MQVYHTLKPAKYDCNINYYALTVLRGRNVDSRQGDQNGHSQNVTCKQYGRPRRYICINPTSNTTCLCAVLAGLGTCTSVLWELVYAREKIHGPVICLLVLTKVEKVTLQVILGARLLPSAGFYSSTLGPEPGNPCCKQLRWWPLKAAKLWCQPSGPQSNWPSAGPSCCAGSPSGTRGLPGYTGA